MGYEAKIVGVPTRRPSPRYRLITDFGREGKSEDDFRTLAGAKREGLNRARQGWPSVILYTESTLIGRVTP